MSARIDRRTQLRLLAVGLLGAVRGVPIVARASQEPDDAPRDREAPEHFRPDPSWRPLGRDLWFDREGGRLILLARVVLREGALEHLLCKRNSKEHEAILATAAAPKMIQAGLLLTGAEIGHTVRFRDDKIEPPAGTAVAIDLEWNEGGTIQRASAREWIVDLKGRTLTNDWVFAGSNTHTDPDTGKTYFGADDGDLVTVVNFPSSLLDLPIESSADDASRNFQARTAVIPPLGTPVIVRLTPRLDKDKKKDNAKDGNRDTRSNPNR